MCSPPILSHFVLPYSLSVFPPHTHSSNRPSCLDPDPSPALNRIGYLQRTQKLEYIHVIRSLNVGDLRLFGAQSVGSGSWVCSLRAYAGLVLPTCFLLLRC